MKIPVKPRHDRQIVDEVGVSVCFARTTKDRDLIVAIINSHEKLVDLAEDLEHGLRYLRQTKAEPYGFGIDRLEEKLQALKEVEKL